MDIYGLSHFRTVISKIKCSNLPAADFNGSSDPYVKIDFDKGYREVKTPKKTKTLNPEWENYSLDFIYETKWAKQLHLKKCVFEVYDHDYLSKHDYLGGAEVDLLTLATGPTRHCLKLYDSDKQRDAGTIEFEIQFEHIAEVTVTFKNVHFHDVKYELFTTNEKKKEAIQRVESMKSMSMNHIHTKTSVLPDFRVSGRPMSKEISGKIRVESVKNAMDTLSPMFEKLTTMVFPKLSLKELLYEGVTLKLKHCVTGIDKNVGLADIYFQNSFLQGLPPGGKPHECRFQVPVMSTNNKEDKLCDVTGEIEFSNLPYYAQLTGGENTGSKTTGQLLLKGLPVPKTFVPTQGQNPLFFVQPECGTSTEAFTEEVKQSPAPNASMNPNVFSFNPIQGEVPLYPLPQSGMPPQQVYPPVPGFYPSYIPQQPVPMPGMYNPQQPQQPQYPPYSQYPPQ